MLIKKSRLFIVIFSLFLSPAIGSAYYFETTLGNGEWKSTPGPISTGGSLVFSHNWWHYENGWRETEMPPNYLEDEFFLIVKSDFGKNGNVGLNIETRLTYDLILTAINATGDFSFPIFYLLTLHDISNSDQITVQNSIDFISAFPGTATYDDSQPQQVQLKLNQPYVVYIWAEAIPIGPINTNIISPPANGSYPDAFMMFSGGPAVTWELSLPNEPVPEPASIVIYGIGAIVVGGYIRSRQLRK